MGIYRDRGSHIHPLITFLSVRVNARCILLIQTTVFITSNGLWEREREKGRRGREGRRERGRKGWGGGWKEMKSISWWATRQWYFYFCLLFGSLCREGAATEVELIMETITLSHTLCGGTLHPLSSIIKINIKFPPPTVQSRYGKTTNLPPPQFYIRSPWVIYYSTTAVALCSRVSQGKNDRHVITWIRL